MSASQDLVAIGRIVGGFGLEGKLKVVPMTHSNERFTAGLSVRIGSKDGATRAATISDVRNRGSYLIVGIEEIRSRTETEGLRGSYVFIDGELRTKLPERTWFIDDIMGITVTDEKGTAIGVVADILILPAHHVYVVRSGRREILVPAIPSVVQSVDLGRRIMVVHLPDGLLDIYSEGGSTNEN